MNHNEAFSPRIPTKNVNVCVLTTFKIYSQRYQEGAILLRMDAMGKDKSNTSNASRGVTHKRTRKRTWFLAFFVAVFVVLLASYALRTSTYLHARLTPKLEKLGIKAGGHFEFNNIYAMGLTGIVLTDVVFSPDGIGADGALRFDAITIYPDLLGMFIGDLNASAIEARGLQARLDFTHAPQSHRTWLKSRRAKLESENKDISVTTDFSESELPSIPAIRCIDCHLELMHDKGEIALDVPSQNVIFSNPSRPWQDISFSGEAVKICGTSRMESFPGLTGDPICVQASSTGLSIEGQTLHIKDLDIGAVAVEPIRLQKLSMKDIVLSSTEDQRFVHVTDGSIEFDVNDDIPQFGGHYAFDYRDLELLHIKERDRIGFGIAVKTTDSTTARIFGGYDRNAQLLGLTIDSQGLNFAPLLKQASFSQKIAIHSLPVTGKVEFRADRIHKNYFLSIAGGVKNASFSMPVLAKDELSGVTGNVDLTAQYDAEENLIYVDIKDGKLGNIQFNGHFTRQPALPYIDNTPLEQRPILSKNTVIPFHYGIDVRFSGDAAQFIPSLPRNFIPYLTGYKLSGPYSGHISLDFDMDNLDGLILNADLALDDVKTLAFDPRSNFELISTNNFMIRVNAATVPKMIGPREASWASFYDIPRETAYTFIASEDAKFFTHAGIDIRAIRASIIANLKADKVVRGGSTISQQVVKNLFLNHDKTLSRKFQEAFLTWQMEKRLSKIRIFELYMNLAHWAKDTYGIRDAAKFYFQKNIRELTLRESLFLATILPNPIIFGKQYADNKLSPARVQKMINVAHALYGAKRIDKSTLDETVELIKQNKISDRPRPRIE